MSRLIGRKLLMGLGPVGSANRVRRFYCLLPRRVNSDRLLAGNERPPVWIPRNETRLDHPSHQQLLFLPGFVSHLA
jgi:hypothetical protein